MRKKTEEIRHYILQTVENRGDDLANAVCEKYDISRQAANRHIKKLVSEKLLGAEGTTRDKKYFSVPLVEEDVAIFVSEETDENRVWMRKVRPLVAEYAPGNVLDILQHAVTEMYNNVIDHSGATHCIINVKITKKLVAIKVMDDGVGIFNKIMSAFQLDDARQAFVELAKGKLTTDPEHHSGEGIFFTSRMFDEFSIFSYDFAFMRKSNEDWLLESETKAIVENEKRTLGTAIDMEIKRNTTRTAKEVFDQFASEFDDYGFTKTHVPVLLSKHEGEKLVSRSQAKRLLARVDRFQEALLDFSGIEEVGQAFADEIFRVFAKRHPDVKLVPVNMSKAVQQMVNRALHHGE